MTRASSAIPFAVACLGIATFALMDTTMKRLSIELGAYAAILWRQGMAAVMAGIFYFRERQPWPGRAAMRFHLMRGCAGAVMATTWFYGLARLPMAEAIALSFIAPIIALFLARLLLGETVGRESIIASLLGLAGVAVMLVARLGDGTDRHLDGVAAILFSAVLYAWNLILMRQQAQVARAIEVAFFQNAISGGWLLIALPFVWFALPSSVAIPHGDQWPLVVAGAALTVVSLFLLSWAYARAEAQALVPVEYTAFVWLSLWGAVFYAEAVTVTTLIGAVLIVAGCLFAAYGRRADLIKVEVGA
ncbi:EamA domain-containing protein [Sphingomonas antarctica]|uniref:DMT family transporter n=1 Tax=Sphingomonas antarctica TaxID=2040274 RepID=UPI0039ED20BB